MVKTASLTLNLYPFHRVHLIMKWKNFSGAPPDFLNSQIFEIIFELGKEDFNLSEGSRDSIALMIADQYVLKCGICAASVVLI